jgi:hypothetical protein
MFNEMLRDNKVDCSSTTAITKLMTCIKLKFYFLCQQCCAEEIALDSYEEGRIIRNQHELLTGHKDCCRLYTKQIVFRDDCPLFDG